MSHHTTPTEIPAPLALPAELSIYTVGGLRPHWLAWLADAGDGPHVLDAAAVDEIDGAGLQLVLALAGQIERDGHTLAIRTPSAPFAAACRSFGLAALLGDAEEVAR